MDETRFDTLARALAVDGNRRGVLRRGALGALGATLAGLGIGGGVEAAGCRGRDAPCRRDAQCCSGTCRRNGTCTPAGLGDPCDPDKPADCRSGECGCTKEDVAGRLINCTCRRATCAEQSEGCDATADCCNGFCLRRSAGNRCFPPAKQCIPEGQSCSNNPERCCPGFDCIAGKCAG